MEIAGVVFGGIPLILNALEKYAKVAKILKDYADYEATLDRLRTRLWIQEEQYDETMEFTGLKDMSLDEVGLQLRQRYPNKCDKFLGIIKRINVIAEKIAGMLDVGNPTKRRWWQEGEDRFKAEIRRILLSLDLEDGELRQLFNELDVLNNALKNCFAKMEVPSAESVDNRIVKRLRNRFDADRCNAASRNARALHGALRAGWGCTCSMPHKGSVRLMWHAEEWLSPSRFEMALSYGSTSASAQHELWRHVTVNVEEGKALMSVPASMNPETAVPTRSGLKDGIGKSLRRVKIKDDTDTVHSPKSPTTGSSTTASTTKPPDHITLLCEDLQNCVDVDKELGYLLHPDPAFTQHIRLRSSAVKPSSQVNSRPVSGKSKGSRLTRKRRFEIASSVCWGVLLLTNTEWLSEDLTKDEVQLMTDVCKNHIQDDWEDTYVSYLFDGPQTHAASSQPTTNTSRGFIRNRTLFALGILLMELCLNRTFPAFRGELQGNPPSGGCGPSTDDDIDDCLEEVYNEAGDEYGYAVQRCLRCEFPGPDRQKSFQHSPFRAHFFHGVVAPVQATFQMISNPSVAVGM
ncbi:hypothetical protein SVAN01_06876 [Stagonosporopsis vannaccii]|nr:hypothetical protein SVAN01_06876 [Stagonosporopsis vannaccii]